MFQGSYLNAVQTNVLNSRDYFSYESEGKEMRQKQTSAKKKKKNQNDDSHEKLKKKIRISKLIYVLLNPQMIS